MNEKIKKSVEDMRENLYNLMNSNEAKFEEVLKLSTVLDSLIVDYYVNLYI